MEVKSSPSTPPPLFWNVVDYSLHFHTFDWVFRKFYYDLLFDYNTFIWYSSRNFIYYDLWLQLLINLILTYSVYMVLEVLFGYFIKLFIYYQCATWQLGFEFLYGDQLFLEVLFEYFINLFVYYHCATLQLGFEFLYGDQMFLQFICYF